MGSSCDERYGRLREGKNLSDFACRGGELDCFCSADLWGRTNGRVVSAPFGGLLSKRGLLCFMKSHAHDSNERAELGEASGG